MALERGRSAASLIDVLDRVLDKGIVIDAWVRVSVVGMELVTLEARVVVASISTYLEHARELGPTGLVSRPIASGSTPPRARASAAAEHSADTAPLRTQVTPVTSP